MSDAVRTLGRDAYLLGRFDQRLLHLRTYSPAWRGACVNSVQEIWDFPLPSPPKRRLPGVGSQPQTCTSTPLGQETGGVPFGEKWSTWEKRPTEACQWPSPSPQSLQLVFFFFPIGFLVFSLKQEQKNKGRLTLNKLPACELHPNKPADREELGENKGKHRKEKKNWKGNGHSHKGFFKKWHLWNRTGCYKKEKKKWANKKVS